MEHFVLRKRKFACKDFCHDCSNCQLVAAQVWLLPVTSHWLCFKASHRSRPAWRDFLQGRWSMSLCTHHCKSADGQHTFTKTHELRRASRCVCVRMHRQVCRAYVLSVADIRRDVATTDPNVCMIGSVTNCYAWTLSFLVHCMQHWEVLCAASGT
eukprot:1103236-Amphidinium_carterae.1